MADWWMYGLQEYRTDGHAHILALAGCIMYHVSGSPQCEKALFFGLIHHTISSQLNNNTSQAVTADMIRGKMAASEMEQELAYVLVTELLA
jgi:hypothetical protein